MVLNRRQTRDTWYFLIYFKALQLNYKSIKPIHLGVYELKISSIEKI